MYGVEYVFLFVSGSCAYAGIGLLSQLAKGEDGDYEFSMPTVVLLSELIKLLMSCTLFVKEVGTVNAFHAVVETPWRTWMLFSIPSILYSFNNNIALICNQHMDAATFQVVSQVKILTTGVLWWFVFGNAGQAMGRRKWFALFLLMVGGAASAFPHGEKKTHMYMDNYGVVSMMLHVSLSAVAAVCTEYLYKNVGITKSVHFQNIAMYIFGVLLNFIFYTVTHSDLLLEGRWLDLLFLVKGFNFWCYCLALNLASMGLLVAFVLKYLNNIYKLMMNGAAMYVSAILTVLLFRLFPTPEFVFGMLLVTVALVMYHWERRGEIQMTVDTANVEPAEVVGVIDNEDSVDNDDSDSNV